MSSEQTLLKENNNYLDRYQEIYHTIAYGCPNVSRGLIQAKYMSSELKKGDKVLCVGCGNGYEVVEYLLNGMDAYGTETHPIEDVPILKDRIVNAVCPGLPFKSKEFKLVQCCEVLEHIPEEITIPFISELLDIGEKVFFTTATKDDPPFYTHINYHGPEWWIYKLDEIKGIKIINFQYNPMTDVIYEGKIMSRRVDKDRVSMYVSKD